MPRLLKRAISVFRRVATTCSSIMMCTSGIGGPARLIPINESHNLEITMPHVTMQLFIELEIVYPGRTRLQQRFGISLFIRCCGSKNSRPHPPKRCGPLKIRLEQCFVTKWILPTNSY